jgi:hypothetical protein
MQRKLPPLRRLLQWVQFAASPELLRADIETPCCSVSCFSTSKFTFLSGCKKERQKAQEGPERAFLLANIFPKMASPHMMPTQYRFTANGHDDMRILRV